MYDVIFNIKHEIFLMLKKNLCIFFIYQVARYIGDNHTNLNYWIYICKTNKKSILFYVY